jgi:competence protein ComEC
VDRFTVWRYGATAVWLEADHATLVSDRDWRGDRPWVEKLPEPHPRAVPASLSPPAQPETEAKAE